MPNIIISCPSQLCRTAIAAYTAASKLLTAFDTDIEEDAEYLVSCLKTARTEGTRWKAGADARQALTRLPAPADVRR